MKKKRILGLLLTLALVLGLTPGTTMTAAAEYYGLIVGGTQVTSEVLSGDGWSYNNETKTLTLNGFSYTNEGNGIKYSGEEKLNIELKGKNTITTNVSSGIYLPSSVELSFSGPGTLSVTSNGDNAYAINTDFGKITIESGSVTLIADNREGIWCGRGSCPYPGGRRKCKGEEIRNRRDGGQRSCYQRWNRDRCRFRTGRK